MERLLGYAQPYMERGAQAVFLKGERAEEELREARKSWQFTHELVPSQSDPRGRLVRIGSLRRVRSA
jgi:16S rRNA (guanine527-N7)-methyltransferase